MAQKLRDQKVEIVVQYRQARSTANGSKLMVVEIFVTLLKAHEAKLICIHDHSY